MILLAYARYPKMALLVIDPQGEFAGDLRGGSTGEFLLPMAELTKALNKNYYILTVRNLVLDRWELFEQILFESLFFERLTIPRGENRQLACRILCDRLQKKKIKLKDLYIENLFLTAWEILSDEKVQKIFLPIRGSSHTI